MFSVSRVIGRNKLFPSQLNFGRSQLWKLDSGIDATASVHVAKSVSSEAYIRACDFSHEVHAGIGVMREYGLTLHTKMSRSLYHCLGAPKLHLRRLEKALGLVA